MVSGKSQRMAIIASTIGSGLEWYEFALFAYLAPVLAKVFFPPSSDLASFISTLLIFAIGFIARPLGGLFFGYFGDRFGRRNALFYSIVLITAPTFFIGLLPTYAHIGWWAPLLLAILRFLQSFPAGGEFPGAMCYLVESSSSAKRGYMGSWTFFGSQLGSIFSMVETLVLEHYLPEHDFEAWGWRLSFIFGGLIGLLGCFLRFRLKETPIFEAVEAHHHVALRPIRSALKTQKKNLAMGFFFAVLPLAGYYMLFVFSPIFLQKVVGISYFHGLIINGAMLVLSTVLLPFIGILGDKYSTRFLLLATAIGVILFVPFLYFSPTIDSLPRMLIVQAIVIILISFHFALLPRIMTELFPSSLRFTSVALSYNLSNMFVGGSAPAFALALIHYTTNAFYPALLFIAAALLTLVAVYFSKNLSD